MQTIYSCCSLPLSSYLFSSLCCSFFQEVLAVYLQHYPDRWENIYKYVCFKYCSSFFFFLSPSPSFFVFFFVFCLLFFFSLLCCSKTVFLVAPVPSLWTSKPVITSDSTMAKQQRWVVYCYIPIPSADTQYLFSFLSFSLLSLLLNLWAYAFIQTQIQLLFFWSFICSLPFSFFFFVGTCLYAPYLFVFDSCITV